MHLQSVGFIGFGEAAYHIAKGLRHAGLPACFAFDIQPTPLIQQRAAETGTHLVASTADLASSTRILFSLVTASSALQAARQTAASLSAEHLYVDCNSVSPALKQSIEQEVTRGTFVEAAVMAPVPPYLHQVPMLLTGSGASELIDALSPFGVSMRTITGSTGSAAAVKMCRSIVVKGLEALLFECTRAASAFGAEDLVFNSLSETFPGMDWQNLASYMLGRVVVHGERRAHEMHEVAATLRSIQIEPIMSQAIARVQSLSQEWQLKDQFGPSGPAHYREVMEAISRL